MRPAKRHIRVLHLGSPTGLYGAERWILALARNLPAETVESWVAAIKDSPTLDVPLCASAANLGLATRVFESFGRFSLSAVGKIRDFILKHEVNILHTHGYKTDILGRLAVRGTYCKTVATPHGWTVNGGAYLKVYEALDRLAFIFMDAVAPLSQELYAEIGRLPFVKHKLHFIPNGVDLAELNAVGTAPEPLAKWRTEGRSVVGYVGRLVPGKRIDILLKAFHFLKSESKRLCIVGDGPERERLEALAAAYGMSAQVFFSGYRQDRLQLLKAFDVFVLPSESEGLPRCVMEAMGAGIPVVASDIAGCRAILEDGSTGMLFKPGDGRELAIKLDELISNPKLRISLATRAKQAVESRYSGEAMAAKYYLLYMELAGGGHAPSDSLRGSLGAP